VANAKPAPVPRPAAGPAPATLPASQGQDNPKPPSAKEGLEPEGARGPTEERDRKIDETQDKTRSDE
jgi:hypothetical protein